jgi:hypothetical protein
MGMSLTDLAAPDNYRGRVVWSNASKDNAKWV